MENESAPSGTYVARASGIETDSDYEPTMDHWFGIGDHCGSENMVLQLAKLEPGAATRAHYHVASDTGCYALAGECQIRTWDADFQVEERRIGKGDFLYIPRGVMHKFINEGEVPFEVLGVYNNTGSGEGSIKCYVEEAI